LPADNVNRIVRDSRGFLWFCTEEGLSRFDGYQFINYTVDQGLPDRRVTDLLEARDGSYWVATGGGVCRFNPTGVPRFRIYLPGNDAYSRRIETLVEDKAGVIWCGTRNGLYRLRDRADGSEFEFVQLALPNEGTDFVQIIIEDRQASLWIGTQLSGLYRRWPDGRVEHYTTRNGLSNRIETLLEDSKGRIWAGTPDGLGLLVASPDPGRPILARLYTTKDGLVTSWIESLFQSADGRLWAGCDSGLIQFNAVASKTEQQFRQYTIANGLSSQYVQALAEDRDGNIWLGTDSGGTMKVVRSGLTNFSIADGLGAAGVDAIFEDHAGELCVISSFNRHYINRFDGSHFKAVWPYFPKEITSYGWGNNQVTLQDRAGEWWVPTGRGLCRFPAVRQVEQLARTRPMAVYTTRDGLSCNDVFRLYEDSRGDIWISTTCSDKSLSRWERSTQTLRSFSDEDWSTAVRMGSPSSFSEDASGNLWIGHWSTGLTRYATGRFVSFIEADGLPAGTIRSLFLDHAHRLWIASSRGGLARLDDTAADKPRFISYTTTEGLSSNDVWCVTEDRDGQIYVGTGRGMDRLDPESGYIKHFTSADGLMVGKVTSAYRDRHGALWFASNVHGLSRLVPVPDPATSAPPILISGLRIAGVTYPISQFGESELPTLDLSPNENQLDIDFVGLSFGAGEVLRYQYQLEGADRDWTPLSDRRSVSYANLAPGAYRFRVRAVNDEGLSSASPAILTFRIRPPVWRRWWFLTLAGGCFFLVVFAAHRVRVARLIELERVRTRIATDLHDDIGANLSLIAMLSEVARGQLAHEDQRMKEWFSTIANTSRDTVDSMSDIVWAVNPKRDQLRDTVQRMRRFAEDVFGPRDVEFEFHGPDQSRDLKVGADLRREVFLIFKENINNMARHSDCTFARVDLQIQRRWLVLKMSDNGRGFDVNSPSNGNGLASMRLRAEKLGGSLEVSSPHGSGTVVTLRVPLDH